MIHIVRRLYNSTLVRYSFLNYFDKGLNFLLPLSLIFIVDNRAVYNQIELILGYAMIAASFIDFGFRGYLFYGYSNSSNKQLFAKLIEEEFEKYLNLYGIIIVLSSIFLFVFNDRYEFLTLVILFVTIRTTYLFITSYLSVKFRLLDIPNRIFYYSIPVSLATLLTVYLFYRVFNRTSLSYFFAGQASLIIYLLVKNAINSQKFKIHFDVKAIKESFLYSWPILLNSVMSMILVNFSKIYGYDVLTESQMTQLSYTLRIGLVIQLAHVSFAGFFTKELFIEKGRKKILTITFKYLFVLFTSSILSYTIILAINVYSSQDKFQLFQLFLILFYLTWSCSAYCELFLNKARLNVYIPIFSLCANIVYFSILISTDTTLVTLSASMLTGSVITLFLNLFLISHKRLI